MDETFKFYSQILDNAITNSNFWANYFLAPYSFDDTIPDFPDVATNICCGVSRVALVAVDKNEVVKFDISCKFCQNELNIYRAAKEQHLEQCFAAVRYVGTYIKTITVPVVTDLECFMWGHRDDIEDAIYECGEIETCTICLPLYAYEKVGHYIYHSTTVSPKEKAELRHTNSPLIERSYEVGAAIKHCWGEDTFWELSDFCNEWNINDLHTGNVGWRGDDFVIMDYAGWHDEF